MTDMDNIVKAIGANYAVWNEDTTITLCNVRWDSQYKNIVKFANKAALNDYLESDLYEHTNIGKARYVKVNEPIKLPLPIDKVMQYNYVKVHNPTQKPVNGEEQFYYYFINGVDFTAPGVTTIQVQLDVWQTFGDKAQFSSAFVEQGHIGVANSKQWEDYGRKYLTVPEGLDTGAEMLTQAVANQPIINKNSASVAMVCASNILEDPESTDGKPELSTGSANYVQGMVSGVPTYFFKSVSDFVLFTTNYSPYPWITSAIKSVTLVPDAFSNGERYTEVKLAKGNISVYRMQTNQEAGRGKYVNMRSNFRDFIAERIAERYRNLKKFLTYPYSVIEMTMMQGSNIILKPENMPGPNANVVIKSNNLTPGQKLMAYARGYNSAGNIVEWSNNNPDGSKEYFYDGGDYLENAVVMDNYPTLAITGDAGNLSLAQNYNAIAQERKTADWSQQKTLAGNQTSYDNTQTSNQNMDSQAQIGRWATQRQNDTANRAQGAQTFIGGVTSLGSGNVVGAAAGAGSGLIDIMARGQNTDTSLAASRASTSANIDASNTIADANLSLGNWAAKGDYANAIASINAKVQDTGLTPPFTVGAAGGETFLMTQGGGVNLYFIMKTIGPAAMMQIGEYWLRYGYRVNTYVRIIPKDLMCMSNFTYWRMAETVLIFTYVPEWVKNVIRGIFEKGVTVWSDPRKIGSIDIADNVPKTGISY